MDANAKYPKAVIRVHWMSAALIIILLGLGLWMVRLELSSHARRLATGVHVAGGLVCLALTLMRLLLLVKTTAPPPLKMSRGHHLAVRSVHLLQYLSLFGLLGSGLTLVFAADLWSVLSESGRFPNTEEMAPRSLHRGLAFAFMGLLVAHVAGSIINQLQGGGTFQRMGAPTRTPPADEV